jgi:HNH endonuclease
VKALGSGYDVRCGFARDAPGDLLVRRGYELLMPYKRRSIKERLLRRTKRADNGCLEWTGYRQEGGYGRMRINHKNKAVHRVSYEEFVGPIPGGMYVCHKCDNPPCLEPEHLWLGTPLENFEDMIRKGRWRN